LVNKLVFENLKHRPLRTLLSIVAIGVQVTMVLTLVGVSRGMLNDVAQRSRGVGADVLVRAPGSSLIGFSTNFSEKFIPFFRKQPHVVAVAGTLVQPIGGIDSITGINLKDFDSVTGGFKYLAGGPFQAPNDMLIDNIYADQHKLRAGQTYNLNNHLWHIAGVVEQGKLSRMFVDLAVLQDLYSNAGNITAAYIKLDNPANTQAVIDELKKKLPDYKIYSMEEFVSLISVDSVPMLRQFIWVIITIGVLIGFIVVFLSMYTSVLERTREIGILKALGASPVYIVGILLRETALLAVAGTLLGIALTYGTKGLIDTAVPTLRQAIVPEWWPTAGALAIGGAMLGATYPGLKAAKQDPIEALAYD
jgi:putative ABC transport system permease protein